MKQQKDEVSANLLKLREARNLSLDKLSELTGVSKSMLRQIETGKSSPTITTIWKIANGLRVSFTSLLKNPVIEAIVKGFKGEELLTAESEHYRLYPLVKFDPQRSFEIYYVEIDPKTVFKGEPHDGDVEEYLFVTSGELQVNVNDQSFSVKQDQFFKFQANCPHVYACVSKKTAKAIMLISYL